MELERLIQALSSPTAYSDPVDVVTMHQTHISVVFLAGDFAYKIRKPVKLGFLDFSTLALRHDDCQHEVRLNRRLAAEVYLGVVPVTRHDSAVAMDGTGETIEWAVKMRRLPDEANLQRLLEHGAVSRSTIEDLARRIAAFHATAETSDRISEFGRFTVVEANCRENFAQSVSQIGVTISPTVFERLQSLSENTLQRHRELIERRAARHVPRDTHGDLRLDHVYLVPKDRAQLDVLIVDCIEFNERFRYADPIADMVFLAMELRFAGHPELAQAFTDAYLGASSDLEGRALIPLYTSYRAAVRGKVEGFKLDQPEIGDDDRAMALAQSRAYWLLATAALARPRGRPCLVLIGGLPGVGKSTLAHDLAEHAEFEIVRSDVVRQELATAAGEPLGPRDFGSGIYSPPWTQRTYAECLRRVEDLLFQGRRVVVDASFGDESRRREFLRAARRWAVPAMLLICRAEAGVVRERLANRRGDASDADWNIHLQAAAAWQALNDETRPAVHFISTDQSRQQSLQQALAMLVQADLFE